MPKKNLDTDLQDMTPSQLRQEVKRLRHACRKELADTCNSRCWITLLESLPEGKKLKPLSMKREAFLKNCSHYYDRNQPKKK
jgi:hypothetical protein